MDNGLRRRHQVGFLLPQQAYQSRRAVLLLHDGFAVQSVGSGGTPI